MIVEIGREELVILCLGVRNINPETILKKFDWALEKRPFTNGDFYRLKAEFLTTATDEELIELYQHYSPSFKQIK